MIVLVASLKAKAGKEKQLEEVLKKMIPNVQTEKGCTKYTLHRSKADAGAFMFYEEYVDQAALDLHNGTPWFKQLGKDLDGLLASDPVAVFWENIAAIKR
jgi:quinol monooxygenase YgiN